MASRNDFLFGESWPEGPQKGGHMSVADAMGD